MLRSVHAFLGNPLCMFFSVVAGVLIEYFFIPKLIEKTEEPKERRHNRKLKAALLVIALFADSVLKYCIQETYAWEDKSYVKEEQKVRSPVSDVSEVEEQVYDPVEYMILQGGQRVLEEGELKGLTSKELYLIRNGMFAFQGRGFHESELSEYYFQFEWYIPTVEPRDFTWDMLNSYQQINVVAIKRIEERRKGN